MKALDRLRQKIGDQNCGTYGSSSREESADSLARAGRARKEEEEVTNSLLYKDIPQDGSVRKTLSPGSERTDISAKSRGPCSRCGQPVTWHDGLRNWFGDLVHHACAGPSLARR
jgi:hypothetical protein